MLLITEIQDDKWLLDYYLIFVYAREASYRRRLCSTLVTLFGVNIITSIARPFLRVDFKFWIAINRPVEVVNDFFWTLDEKDFSNNKLVPVYERVTGGPRRVGSVIREGLKTRYFNMEVFSEITEYTPNRSLGYRFQGAGMTGTLRYLFEPTEAGTKLVQQVNISFKGLRKILNPLLPLTYARKAEWRLRAIKGLLEAT